MTDKIVEDIYALTSRLNAGGSIRKEIEPHIPKFLKDMEEAIDGWVERDEKRVNNLRMSNIGKPKRQLWYDLQEDKEAIEDPEVQIKFLYGHMIEAMVLMLVKAAGHEVTDEQKEVNVHGILGHMDCKIDGEVVDVKSASPFGYKKFTDETLADNDAFGYIPQLAGYEDAEGSEAGGFLVMNKVTGQLCLYRPDDIDKPNMEKLVSEVKEVIEGAEPPEELCYPDIPLGRAGNMSINRGCSFCIHKHKCRSNSNNGKGLRGFKYANGVTYLTRVIKEPKVEEVL